MSKIESEIERGKKFLPGSPKHAKHLARLVELYQGQPSRNDTLREYLNGVKIEADFEAEIKEYSLNCAERFDTASGVW